MRKIVLSRRSFAIFGVVVCSVFSPLAQALCGNHAPPSGGVVVCDTTAPATDPTNIYAPASDSVSVTVQSGAGVSAAPPVSPAIAAVTLRSGTITNNGTIAVTGAGFDAISFAASAAPTSYLINSGTITADGNDVVDARSPLEVTNNATGVISATGQSAFDMGGGGVVTNYGAINGGGIASIRIYGNGTVYNRTGGVISGGGNDGIFLANGSILVNEIGATISGANKGLEVNGSYAGNVDIITNAGTITSTNAEGILLDPDDTTGVINLATGAISGPIGLKTTSGTVRLRNAGTITGTGGNAIEFGNNDDSLGIVAGSVINGNVVATGTNNLLALTGTNDGSFDVSTIGSGLQYQGFTLFNKREASTWTLTNNGAQDWTIEGGTLNVTGTIGSGIAAGGTTLVQAAGTLAGNGTINSQTVNLDGGTLKLSNNAAGDILTIGNDLNATGGTLLLDVALGGNSSPADHLKINGNLTITTAIPLTIANIGGLGAATSGDGILLIEITGTSPANAFQLAAPINVGNYRYDLVQVANGNWHLRSLSTAPTAPIPALGFWALLGLVGSLAFLGWRKVKL